MAMNGMTSWTEENLYDLHQLQDMFKDQLHGDLVRTILQQANFDVDHAVEKLLQVIKTQEPTKKPQVKVLDWPVDGNGESWEEREPTINESQTATSPLPSTHVDPDSVEEACRRLKVLHSYGYKVVILLQGLPGSGKSYLAQKLLKASPTGVTLSTDDFWIDKWGQYCFNGTHLEKAHRWNQQRAETAMKKGTSPVIIDNTNLSIQEMQPYAETAVTRGYLLDILQPQTSWREDAVTLAKKNLHRVPLTSIRRMQSRFTVFTCSDLIQKSLKTFAGDLPAVDNYSARSLSARLQLALATKDDSDGEQIYQSDKEEEELTESWADGAAACGGATSPPEASSCRELGALFPAESPVRLKAVLEKSRGNVAEAANRLLDVLQDKGQREEKSPDDRNNPESTDFSTSGSEMEEEETVPLQMAPSAVKTFLQKFGNPIYRGDAAEELVLQVPIRLARQIHHLMCNAMEEKEHYRKKALQKMIAKDEELACRLARQEEAAATEDNAWLQQEETLAEKMGREALVDRFPEIEPTVLQQIYCVHKKSLSAAAEAVESSLHGSDVVPSQNPSMKPTSLLPTREGNQLWDEICAYRKRCMEEAEEETMQEEQLMECKPDQKHLMALWTLARSQRDKELMWSSFATNAKEQGLFFLAAQCARDARTYSARHEHTHALAAAKALQLNGGGGSGNKIDLHFMTVKSACHFLEVFLDGRQLALNQSGLRSLTVEIVTGKGNHSQNGTPKIKPAVEELLFNRGLRFWEVNAGMLAVELRPKSSSLHETS